MAPMVYKTATILIFTAIALGGVMDFNFWLRNDETISEWLRGNPSWFIVPSLFMGLFLLGLALHLYVLPVEWGGLPSNP